LIVAASSGPTVVADSPPPPDGSSLAAGNVIGKYLSARQEHDISAALELFESEASITDAAGNTARGMNAVTRLMDRYYGFEAGPWQATGNEVEWTEALPIRTPDNLQFQQDTQPELASEVPYYAFVQRMCAVVSTGKIHAVMALTADRTFVPSGQCGGDEEG
jgi:hypothetical protein